MSYYGVIRDLSRGASMAYFWRVAMKWLQWNIRFLMLVTLLLGGMFGWIARSLHCAAERDLMAKLLEEEGAVGVILYEGQTKHLHIDKNGDYSWVKEEASPFYRFVVRYFAGGRRVIFAKVFVNESMRDEWKRLLGFPEIKELDIICCEAMPGDLFELRRFQDLEKLSLVGRGISIKREGIDILGKITTLKRLELPDGTNSEVVDELQAKLPSCKIVGWQPIPHSLPTE
ncbi:hypothetical protein [Bremerella cremea]|nr:hypothetical protein [Bremerella cremea]